MKKSSKRKNLVAGMSDIEIIKTAISVINHILIDKGICTEKEIINRFKSQSLLFAGPCGPERKYGY
jgi:hypothetical protein